MAKQIDAKDLRTAFDLPPEEAIKYLARKGYAVTFDWKAMNAAAHHRAFTVAGCMSADVLVDTRDLIEKSLADGSTWPTFKKAMAGMLAQRGWGGPREVIDPATGIKKTVDLSDSTRLKTIYLTNMQSALNAGRSMQQRAVADRRPFVKLHVVRDKRTSDTCEPLDGKVFRQDDPDLGRVYPPNHHRCRTTASTMSERQLLKSGIDVSTVRDLKDWEPAEGFDTRPELVWEPDLSKYSAPLRNQVKKHLKNAPTVPVAVPPVPVDVVDRLTQSIPDSLREATEDVIKTSKDRRDALAAYSKAFKTSRGYAPAEYQAYVDANKLYVAARAKADAERGSFADVIHSEFLKSTPAVLNATIVGATKADKKNAEEVLDWIRRLIGTKAVTPNAQLTIKYSSSKTLRASANQYGTVKLAKNEDRRTIAHELGHIVEFATQGVYAAAEQWRSDRTKGERTIRLSSISGPGYGSSEVTKPDKFLDAYVGKIYGQRATEVISMGLEYLYAEPERLLLEDPDYFRLLHSLFGNP